MSKDKRNFSSRSFPDLLETLGRTVGATGRVQECYGGVEIDVADPEAFPWGNVLQELLNAKEEVWVRMRDGKIEIMSKSATP